MFIILFLPGTHIPIVDEARIFEEQPDYALVLSWHYAEPIMKKLLEKFLNGMHNPEIIEEQYLNLYSNAIVYGLEEALEGPYKKAGLDILSIENWPVEKINWVPQELKENVGRALTDKFKNFERNLKNSST